MTKEFLEQLPYKHQQIITPDQAFKLTREVVRLGKGVYIFNDFDDNISQGELAEVGFDPGDDPRRSRIDPEVGKALTDIDSAGGHIGIITNRGGSDVAEKLRAIGLHRAKIIGTYGWESYNIDDSNHRSVKIDPRFHPHAEIITKILQGIREDFLDELGNPPIEGDEANLVVPTNLYGKTTRERGPVIIQQKGVSPEEGFPMGLANSYNFNLMPLHSGIRERVKRSLERSYRQADQLIRVWGMGGDGINDGRSANPEADRRFSRSFEPLIKEGKAFGMLELIREIQQEQQARGSLAQDIGLIYFGGDSDADAQAMRAARLLEMVSHGRVKSIGVWSKDGSRAPEVNRRADLKVPDVATHAKILQGIAAALKN